MIELSGLAGVFQPNNSTILCLGQRAKVEMLENFGPKHD